MKKSQLVETLTDIGLTQNEAAVYFAALSVGPSTVLNISRVAGTKRSTTYSVIETLREKGLIRIEEKGFKQVFVAEDPKHLESVLDHRKEIFTRALPEFSALYNLRGVESVIRYHEGIDGLKAIYERILRDIEPGDKYYIIAHQHGWYEHDHKWFERFLEKRSKIRLDTRLLFQDSLRAQEHKRREKQLHQKVKIFPTNVSFTSDIIVCPQRLVIHTWDEPITAIEVQSKGIIQTHIELFEYIWNSIWGEQPS